MSDPDKENINSIARARQRECGVEAFAFGIRLDKLKLFNLATVVLPSVLSVVAGSALFLEWENNGEVKIGIALATLLGAILVAIHRGLKCDTYQEEASRLIREYRCLEAKYRTLGELCLDNKKDLILEYDEELAKLRKSAQADVPESCRHKARQKLDAEIAVTT